jgi:hypothetical protein
MDCEPVPEGTSPEIPLPSSLSSLARGARSLPASSTSLNTATFDEFVSLTSGAHRIAFNQARDDLRTAFDGQFVHVHYYACSGK